MKMITTHFGFRVEDEDGDLIYPRSNLHSNYESPVDFMWHSPNMALTYLQMQEGMLDEAIEEKWVLVKVTTEVIETSIQALVPNHSKS